MAEKKNKGGRPSKKSGLDLRQVEKLAKMGWDDQQMADFFEVDVRTWYRWKVTDDKFCQALKSWKDEADQRVVRSLFERACGYSHPEDKIMQYEGQPVVVPTVKHYAPDTTACIFWLKNRDPEKWRDKVEHDHSGELKHSGVMMVPAGMSSQEWEKQVSGQG